MDESLRAEGILRQVANHVNRLRKAAGLQSTDAVKVRLVPVGNERGELRDVLDGGMDALATMLKSNVILDDRQEEEVVVVARVEAEVADGLQVAISLHKV